MMELWVFLIICILICGLSTIDAATDSSDAAALNVMYTSLNSPSQLTGWSSSGNDPCSQNWKGVTCSASRVTKINIASLSLTGSLGYQLASLSSVTSFDVSRNNLGGSIPYQLPPNVQRLNLASNNFNGEVPYSISQMPSLTYLNLSHNQLSTQLNDIFQKLSQLSTLDLSYNQIPGPLPSSFSSLTSTNTMYLHNNQFTGTIDILADLPLEKLNVENNRFTGWIPQQLQNIDLHKDGNSWSSGLAPPVPPGKRTVKNKPQRSKSKRSSGEPGGKKSGIGGGAIAGIIISLFVVGALVAFFLVKKRCRRSARDIEKVDNEPFAPLASSEDHETKSTQSLPSINRKTFEAVAPVNLKPPPLDHYKSLDEDGISKKVAPVPPTLKSYSIADLQMATGSFSIDNLLGEGSLGRVYRAQFDDGKVFAVKKIESSVISNSSEDFSVIVAKVSRLQSSNVTELVGYSAEHGQHLLVYEFHKNGSLHDLLHLPDEYSKPLTWNTRVMIALGSARALEYLHEVCSPSVVHKKFKSENILLDGDMNPYVADCGLGNLVEAIEQDDGCAPEVADCGQYSVKSDVYSFGVVMLELLTGRKPLDRSRPRSEHSVVRWATPQLHDIDALTRMVDPALQGLYPIKSVSRFADVIALCVQAEPEFRPPMSEVVQGLVRLVQRANMSKTSEN